MKTTLYPYLNFKDNARQAMEFYQSVFGGKLDLVPFAEYPNMPVADASDNQKIMHSMLEGDHGIAFMASDTPKGMEFHPGAQISMSLMGEDEALLRKYWEQLGVGGTVVMPLEAAPWGDTFGMLTDQFGINWMVNIAGEAAK